MAKGSETFCSTNVMICVTCFFTSAALLTLAVVVLGFNSETNYLYIHNSGGTEAYFDPVKDYFEPNKLPFETEEQYRDRKTNPPFLGNDAVNRVVEFYAPWCGHCIHFKPKYIQIAREVNYVEPLTFYAVSCQVHKEICHNQNVKGYPTVKWFPANSNVGEVMNGRTISSDTILTKYLKLDLSRTNAREIPFEISLRGSFPKKSSSSHLAEQKNDSNFLNWDLDKYHVFYDASMSFYYALRNEIFMTNDRLNRDQALALQQWLEILSKALPLSMKDVKNDARSLLASFDDIIQSESNLQKHILKVNLNEKWTDHCSRGREGAGYTCGLWQLFHIVTVSTVEWNSLASHDDMISQEFVAHAIRNYIEQFFSCIECRENFLEMFDNCRFELCLHLQRQEMTEKNTQIDAEWLPLWLWQAHNDVNERLAHENKMKLSNKQYLLWPSLNDCKSCWLDSFSKWSNEEVSNALRKTYWSNISFDLSSIDKVTNGRNHKNRGDIIFVGFLVCMVVLYSTQIMKKKLRRTQKKI